MKSAFLNKAEIKGSKAFGGNNFIFCMRGRKGEGY